MISVLVLTLNEEVNIGDCLDSVAWCDDILVFDSGSTDRTVELAKAKGARVLTRPFDDYGSHRQAALEQGQFKNPWLLVLDADERVDAQLAGELKQVSLQSDNLHSGYRLRVKDHFVGRWIPRAALYPTWHLRFFKWSVARYEKRSVHERLQVDGSVGNLNGHLLHFSFNKGLDVWLEKHRRYAQLEAVNALAMLQQPVDWAGLASLDPARRRRALKAWSYRLPLRGTARFLYMMLIRLAFLDGVPGIRYSLMISRYENWIQEEMKKLRKAGPPKVRRKIFLILLLAALPLAQALYYLWVYSTLPPIPPAGEMVLAYSGGDSQLADGFKLAKGRGFSILLYSGFDPPRVARFIKVSGGAGPVSVLVEAKAGSTDQNARYCAPLIQRAGVRSVVLAAPWYHLPRALLWTRWYLTGTNIKIIPCPTVAMPGGWWRAEAFRLELLKFWGSFGRVFLAWFGIEYWPPHYP